MGSDIELDADASPPARPAGWQLLHGTSSNSGPLGSVANGSSDDGICHRRQSVPVDSSPQCPQPLSAAPSTPLTPETKSASGTVTPLEISRTLSAVTDQHIDCEKKEPGDGGRLDELSGLLSQVRERVELMHRLQSEMGSSLVSPKLAAAAIFGLPVRNDHPDNLHVAGLGNEPHTPSLRTRPSSGLAGVFLAESATESWIPDVLESDSRSADSDQGDLDAGSTLLLSSRPLDQQRQLERPRTVPPLWVGSWPATMLPNQPPQGRVGQEGSLSNPLEHVLQGPRGHFSTVTGEEVPENVCCGDQGQKSAVLNGVDASGNDSSDAWGWLSFRATLGSLIPEMRSHTF